MRKFIASLNRACQIGYGRLEVDKLFKNILGKLRDQLELLIRTLPPPEVTAVAQTLCASHLRH